MANSVTATQVYLRFSEEQESIENFTRYVESESRINDQELSDINHTLRKSHIAPLPERDFSRIGKAFSHQEHIDLMRAVENADGEVFQTILGHEQFLSGLPDTGENGPAADYLDYLNTWIRYVMARLPYDAELQDEEAILRTAIGEYELADVDCDDRIPSHALEALIKCAIERVRYYQVQNQLDALILTRRRFKDLAIRRNVTMPSSHISILRQGFLLLTAAFDAAVFDLVRVAFQERFFELLRVFGKGHVVSLEEIGHFGTFEVFRDMTVEKILKTKYITELVRNLQNLGVAVVDTNSPDKPVHLFELILRRNVHVHNGGRVDDRYLEQDATTGKPKYNIYKLKVGETAFVDADYLKRANRICGSYVRRLTDWVNNSS